jgi:hypothetical protein
MASEFSLRAICDLHRRFAFDHASLKDYTFRTPLSFGDRLSMAAAQGRLLAVLCQLWPSILLSRTEIPSFSFGLKVFLTLSSSFFSRARQPWSAARKRAENAYGGRAMSWREGFKSGPRTSAG